MPQVSLRHHRNNQDQHSHDAAAGAGYGQAEYLPEAAGAGAGGGVPAHTGLTFEEVQQQQQQGFTQQQAGSSRAYLAQPAVSPTTAWDSAEPEYAEGAQTAAAPRVVDPTADEGGAAAVNVALAEGDVGTEWVGDGDAAAAALTGAGEAEAEEVGEATEKQFIRHGSAPALRTKPPLAPRVSEAGSAVDDPDDIIAAAIASAAAASEGDDDSQASIGGRRASAGVILPPIE